MNERSFLLAASAGLILAFLVLDGGENESTAAPEEASPSPSAGPLSQTGDRPSAALPTRVARPLHHQAVPVDAPEQVVEVGERNETAYVSGRIMLRVAPGARLQAVASHHGLAVVEEPGLSGYAELALPEDTDWWDLRADLQLDPAIASVAPMGRIRGCGSDDLEIWHPEAAGTPSADEDAFSDWIVAVLDTGVAYEDHSDDLGTYVAVDSLADVEIHAPYDFVNDDEHANDDYQHGTHVAGTIASTGAVPGIAAGAGLMPLKVLGSDNTGDELDLVDALYHAADNGADVINMSLSFSEGYVLSEALGEALMYAWDAGAVMVAATGNQGESYVAWPAAHPRVIAVGATQLKNKSGKQEVADYSNLSSRVDLLAPGGNLDLDENKDGYPDGILAETIGVQDPASTGYWFYAGTSQAAAIVSGAAVHLLEEGVAPHRVRDVLQGTTAGDLSNDPFGDGFGAGRILLDEAVDAVTDDDRDTGPRDAYFVSMIPYLRNQNANKVRPALYFTLLDEDGLPVEDAEVYGTYWGTTSGGFSCTTSSNGTCHKRGKVVSRYDGDELARLGWAVSIGTVLVDGVAYHPGGAFFAPDGLEVLLAAIAEEAELYGLPFIVHWSEDDDDYVDMAESYMVVDMGTGLATSPLGVVLSPKVFEDASFDTYEVDLDGTGLATSPLGVMEVTRISLDGTGLATSPLGLTDLSLLELSGTGLATSPLGFSAYTLFGVEGSSYDEEAILLDDAAVLLGDETLCSEDLSGTTLGTHLDSGGWLTGDGYPAASAFTGSGLADLTAAWTDAVGSGQGAGAEPM